MSLTDDLAFYHVHHHGQSLQNLKPKSTLSAVIGSWSWYCSNRNVSNTNAREMLLSQLDVLLAENQSRNKWLSTHHGSNNTCSQYKVTLFQSPHKSPMCCSVQTQFQPAPQLPQRHRFAESSQRVRKCSVQASSRYLTVS